MAYKDPAGTTVLELATLAKVKKRKIARSIFTQIHEKLIDSGVKKPTVADLIAHYHISRTDSQTVMLKHRSKKFGRNVSKSFGPTELPENSQILH